MTEQRDSSAGWLARGRERRRVKRQQELERAYHDHERVRGAYTTAYGDGTRVGAYGTWWFAGGLGGGGE